MSDHISSPSHDARVLAMLAIVGLPALAAFWVTSLVLGPNHLSLSIYHSHLPSLGWLMLFAVIWAILLVVAVDAVKRVRRLGIPSLAAVSGKRSGSPFEHSRLRLPQHSADRKDRRGLPDFQLLLGVTKSGRWLCAPRRDSVLVLGTPQRGKSSSILIPNIEAWDGSCLATSSKFELVQLSSRRKLAQGKGKVYLLDLFADAPDLPGVIRIAYSPVDGAEDWDTAIARAGQMTAETMGGGVSKADHWESKGGDLLACLLHAAALSDNPRASQVSAWLNGSDFQTPQDVLRSARGAAPSALEMLSGLIAIPPGERGSIISTATSGVRAYSQTAVRNSEAQGARLDLKEFLSGPNTLYILVPPHRSKVGAPVVLGFLDSLTTAIQEMSRGGRLPLPFLAALDELANISPIPQERLSTMLSESPGRDCHYILTFQDFSQVRARWGDDFATSMLTLCPALTIFGGNKDINLLSSIAELVGGEKVALHRSAGQELPENLARGDRLTAHEIAELPRGQIYAIQAGADPQVIKKAPWYETEPFKSWTEPDGPPPDTSGSGEQFKAVMKFRNRLRLPEPTLVDHSGVPAIQSGNENALSTAVQDSHALPISREKSTLVRDCPQQPVEYEITSEKQPTDEEKPKPLDEAWRERFEPIELVPLKPLEGLFADPLDSEPPLPVGRPSEAKQEPQAPISATDDRNRWPGLCERCTFRVGPRGGRATRGGDGWLTWHLDCYRDHLAADLSEHL